MPEPIPTARSTSGRSPMSSASAGLRPPSNEDAETTMSLDEYVFEALKAGASGFLVKDTEPAKLVRAVRAVAAGDPLLSPGSRDD